MVWGALHGFFLTTNHFFSEKFGHRMKAVTLWKLASFVLTSFCVMIAWVFFRAESLSSAIAIFDRIMHLSTADWKNVQTNTKIFIPECFLMVWFLPNTMEIFGWIKSRWPKFNFEPKPYLAVVVAVLLTIVVLSLNQPSEFIYFQF